MIIILRLLYFELSTDPEQTRLAFRETIRASFHARDRIGKI